ncbi:MAG: hypothetical protein IJA91_04810 [Clostridia bacterium]|nr:hypothetical protein [Clostridia bacterium]
MDQREQQLHTRSRLTVGILTAVCGLLLAGTLLAASVGVSYGRYMTTGTAAVSFQATPKPLVAVESTTAETLAASVTVATTYHVTCEGDLEDASIHIRIFGFGETAPTLTVQTADNNEYTVTARALASTTMSGAELGAEWVYIFTDVYGEEIPFILNGDGLTLTVASADAVLDISQLVIRAEAVKES